MHQYTNNIHFHTVVQKQSIAVRVIKDATKLLHETSTSADQFSKFLHPQSP